MNDDAGPVITLYGCIFFSGITVGIVLTVLIIWLL